MVRKSSSNFLKKLVKNFDDKDAPPIPTSQYSQSSISLASPSGMTGDHGSHSLVPEMPMLRSLSSQNIRRIGPLDTPPPLSPLMGYEMAYQFAAPMDYQDSGHHAIDAEVHPSSWPNSSTSAMPISGSQYMTTVLSPQEVADSLAQLVADAALVTEDRDTEVDEEEDEEEDGDEDEDEDEDVPAAITNRLSRLYDTGSIHLNQSQTSLYYSTKSTLSDSEASEMMGSMSPTLSPNTIKPTSDDVSSSGHGGGSGSGNNNNTGNTSHKGGSSSKRGSYVQDALGYSLGLSRGNSIRFSQYNLGTMQGFSGAPVQPLSSSISTPTSPGTVRGTSSTAAANQREFGEARKSVTRRPVTMFIPLTSSAADQAESDVDNLTVSEDPVRETAAAAQPTVEQDMSSPPTSPYRESRLQERNLQSLTVDTASLPPTDTIDSSPILPSSFGRSLSIQATAPKRPMTVCVDTNQSLAPLYPLATPTLLTPDDPPTGEQRESTSLLAQRTARRCFEEDESFLRREEISEYLGTPKPFHRQVLGAYMNHFDFRGKRIDLAFRLLCQKLILKGETQEVDRILEAFARRYVDCNDGRQSESSGGRSRPMLLAVADHAKDVVHAVSYSILLLNTDLHVVQQSTKMSRSAFVKNTLEVVQAQRGGAITPGMGSPVHTVDPVGLGMPRSLTSDSIAEAGLAPSSSSSFPSMGRRRTPSVKSWKSGHSQQSTNYDMNSSSSGGNVAHSSGSSNSRMGSDPSANGGYGNGKAWIQELESLFKEIYTAVKHSQIRLPSPTSATQTPVSGPHSSRAGSRSNSTFSAISSPPTSPAMAPVGGFGSSLFSSNRMSRLIQPSTLFTSNQTQQQQQQPLGGDLDYPTDSGVGIFGGSVNRRKSMSTRASQLRNDAIQRLSAQAQAQAQANVQAMANAVAVAQAQAEADAEMRERNSAARLASSANALTASVAAPTSRSRYSVFGNLDVSFGGGGGNTGSGGSSINFVDRGPVSSRDVVYPQQSLSGSSRRHSHFAYSEIGTNTSASTDTTPSASQNSLASLQSSTLSTSAGGPRDEPRSKPAMDDHSNMEHKPEDSISSGPPSLEASSFLDEFTAEQKEQRHQLHLQSRYRMEGILWRKHLLERSDKKAQHRAWRQLLVVLDMEQGSLAMFRSDGTLPSMSKSTLPSPSLNPTPSTSAGRTHSSGHRTNPTTPTSSTTVAHMALFDEIPLQHTITNILPPPGYSSTRRNVFAVQLFTGGVYLFQTSTPQECENWARSCNYWAARTSKEPLAGGVINMEYGWGRALETYLSRSPLSPSASLSPLVTGSQHDLGLSPLSQSALTSPFAQSPGAMSSASATSPSHYLSQAGSEASGYFGITSSNPAMGNSSSPLQMRSSGRSTSMKSSSSRRGSISLSSFGAMTGVVGSGSSHSLIAGAAALHPGDQVTLFEWTAPQPAMALSPHTEEADQLWALKKYVRELESEMEAHQEHRGPMLKLFPPKSVNHVKAFNNWERRSRHLLKEMVKNKIYEECLAMSIAYQNEQDLLELKAWQTLQRPPRPPQPHPLEGPLSELRKEPGLVSMGALSSSSSDLEADLEALVVHDEPDL
ncbi:PH and SEC7 domain-containing protein [Entomortierella parvispora]|uniref:PH and SEC7 domain-containing protein n=1 Tax=Entomortierella parvispora TaxID=205924 RepID=A0A9P3H845_9FUNG|nr:PH and SEC7 domain-containing protein [Entomortierella parvispora]